MWQKPQSLSRRNDLAIVSCSPTWNLMRLRFCTQKCSCQHAVFNMSSKFKVIHASMQHAWKQIKLNKHGNWEDPTIIKYRNMSMNMFLLYIYIIMKGWFYIYYIESVNLAAWAWTIRSVCGFALGVWPDLWEPQQLQLGLQWPLSCQPPFLRGSLQGLFPWHSYDPSKTWAF